MAEEQAKEEVAAEALRKRPRTGDALLLTNTIRQILKQPIRPKYRENLIGSRDINEIKENKQVLVGILKCGATWCQGTMKDAVLTVAEENEKEWKLGSKDARETFASSWSKRVRAQLRDINQALVKRKGRDPKAAPNWLIPFLPETDVGHAATCDDDDASLDDGGQSSGEDDTGPDPIPVPSGPETPAPKHGIAREDDNGSSQKRRRRGKQNASEVAAEVAPKQNAAEVAPKQNAAEAVPSKSAVGAAPGGGTMEEQVYEYGWDEEMQVAWRMPLSGPRVGKKELMQGKLRPGSSDMKPALARWADGTVWEVQAKRTVDLKCGGKSTELWAETKSEMTVRIVRQATGEKKRVALLIFAAREGQRRSQLLQLLLPHTGDAAGSNFEAEATELVVDLAKKFTSREVKKKTWRRRR